MNLCKHCKYYYQGEWTFAEFCTHPNLGPSRVHGREMRFPCEVARKLPDLCGVEGRWYMAAPELKITRRA